MFELSSSGLEIAFFTTSANEVSVFDGVTTGSSTQFRWRVDPFNEFGTTSGKQYKLVLDNGILKCNCPGYKYRGKCKHIANKANEIANEIAAKAANYASIAATNALASAITLDMIISYYGE